MSEADRIIRRLLAERDRKQAESGQVPLYARPHAYSPGSPGRKCEVCGNYAEDGIHRS